MPTHPKDIPFHRSKRINWTTVLLGVAIPLCIAALITATTAAKSAWDNKATVSDVKMIIVKLDSLSIRVQQLKCGRTVEDGCR